MQGPRLKALAASTLLMLAVFGCGAEDRDSPTAGSESEGHAEEFLVKGGDNSIQSYGKEASEAQRELAADAMRSYFEAAVESDEEEGCRFLSPRVYGPTTPLGRNPRLQGAGCEKIVGLLWGAISPEAFADSASAEVRSFRRRGYQGYALFHGGESIDYAMPMVLETGEWKVAGVTATALFR